MLAFAACFLWSIDDLEWVARANGSVIGSVLVALIALQLGQMGLKAWRGEARLPAGKLLEPHSALHRRIASSA
ncbi:MAG: hypothetical protein AB7F96_03710 [Beijerinckiaceae bacterium]